MEDVSSADSASPAVDATASSELGEVEAGLERLTTRDGEEEFAKLLRAETDILETLSLKRAAEDRLTELAERLRRENARYARELCLSPARYEEEGGVREAVSRIAHIFSALKQEVRAESYVQITQALYVEIRDLLAGETS